MTSMTTDVYLTGVGTHLPSRRSTAEAVAGGEYAQADREKDGYESVCVSDLEGPDMAVDAGEKALAAAGIPRGTIGTVYYSHIHRQGPDMWSVASYLQRGLAIEGAAALALEQGCNGGMAAVELAVRTVRCDPDRAALAATGDRFALPGFDRWRSDYGIVYGDAGTAAVISTRPGVARFRAIASVTEATLEEMHRGVGGGVGVPAREETIDLRARKKEYLGAYGGREHVTALSRAAVEPLVARVLDEAGVAQRDLALIVLPNLGRSVVEPLYLDLLGVDHDATAWRFGRTTGHLGAGDMLAGVDQARASGAVGSGDIVMLLGAGAGYSWTCAVVELC
jgi:3-oxoacyl-[acyl-carrier-protein] synthase III